MIRVEEVSHHLRWEHNIRIRSALTCYMREMGKVWSNDMKYLKPLLRETAEAFCIFCGVIPHSNSKLLQAKQIKKGIAWRMTVSRNYFKGRK